MWKRIVKYFNQELKEVVMIKKLLKKMFHLEPMPVQQAIVIPLLSALFVGVVIWVILELIKAYPG